MTRHEQVRQLFDAALTRAPDARAAYVAEMCAGDASLAREVAALLAAQAAAGSFLSTPAGSSGSLRAGALTPGTRLASYEILSSLGAGGMGEVYRARDTKLGRDVALKILPDSFTHDPERIARFRREAQVLASLNHPHIAQIHGLEEANGTQFLVLELVDGESLAERIKRGPLPIDEALPIVKQIGEALEAAHEKGIIHRDLKPANIALTKDGNVKVLDFGLAKSVEPSVSGDLAHSPTLTSPAIMTGVGMILGTAAYMSPEQAKGRAADKRSDVWAFGCVLYEMLTGKRAFVGEDVSDTLAFILTKEPEWSALPPTTPPLIRRLLRHALDKDRKRRLADIADAIFEIEEALDGGVDDNEPTTAPEARLRLAWVVTASALLVTVLSVGTAVRQAVRPREASPPNIARFAVALPPSERITGLNRPAIALSPDGSKLAYVGTYGTNRQIYLRFLNRLQATRLPGTDDASFPFFSPDGQWIGFFAEGQLKKVSINGGPPLVLAAASSTPFGAVWKPDGAILFARGFGTGLLEVSGTGGRPKQITQIDASRDEYGHLWPSMLPGGKTVLFAVAKRSARLWHEAQIVAQSLETGQRHILVEGGTSPRYASTGHLLYVRAGTLMAVPFDPDRLELRGGAVPVVEGVAQSATGAAHLAMADDGTLVYLPSDRYRQDLVWVSRAGAREPLSLPVQPYATARLSPDGSRVVVWTLGINCDLWIYDLSRGTFGRLTFEGDNHFPIWTRDGHKIVYSSSGSGLFWKPADGSGVAERLATLTPGHQFQSPAFWSPNGQVLVFEDVDPSTRGDIWSLSPTHNGLVRPLLRTPFDEARPTLSRDGLLMAYESDESGQRQIYVQPFPEGGPKWQVSTDGGTEPLWAPSGRELFYRKGDQMMVVQVQLGSKFSASRPRVLFTEQGVAYSEIGPQRTYDVTPDGQRFLFVEEAARGDGTADLHVVMNWSEELKARVPTK